MNDLRPLPAWQQAIIAKCHHPSGEWIEFPLSALDRSLVTRFEEMVARNPDRLALKTDDRNSPMPS
jgi:hypothetical protein